MSMLHSHSRAGSPVVYTVAPVPGGWAIASDANAEPLMFLSGARAEAAACVLARATASAGLGAEVIIHDRNGKLAGSHRFRANSGAGAPHGDASRKGLSP